MPGGWGLGRCFSFRHSEAAGCRVHLLLPSNPVSRRARDRFEDGRQSCHLGECDETHCNATLLELQCSSYLDSENIAR